MEWLTDVRFWIGLALMICTDHRILLPRRSTGVSTEIVLLAYCLKLPNCAHGEVLNWEGSSSGKARVSSPWITLSVIAQKLRPGLDNVKSQLAPLGTISRRLQCLLSRV